MPASLVTRRLVVSRGARRVLDEIDLTLTPGRRLGVVGPNGVGKTTLLRALAGLEPPESGSVEVCPAVATVGYLPQEPGVGADGETVVEHVARRTGVAAAQAALDRSIEELAAGVDGADARYARALDRWIHLGAADLEVRIGEVWDELDLLPGLLDGRAMGALSGGERARVSLAALFLSRFDVVLLDEPTNHLDLASLDRLASWVTGLDAAVALVSHDRWFLERTVTDVAEIDEHRGRVSVFAGGWDAYLDEREHARRRAQERHDAAVDERDRLADRARRQREWADRGRSRVRRSGERDKFVRHHRVDQTERLAAKAAQTERRLDRLDEVEGPRRSWELRLEFPAAGRSGDLVLAARDAVVERGDLRLGPVDVEVRWGDRVAVTGANGSGKTTLLDLLLGRLDVDDGLVEGEVRRGDGVIVGEIDQLRSVADPSRPLLDVAVDAMGGTAEDVRALLAKFGLVADHVHRPVSTASPGERTRLELARLMANGANLLVLDEPTNHLDLPAIEQLDAALGAFGGTVLLVSHDRRLLDSFASTRELHVDRGRVVERS